MRSSAVGESAIELNTNDLAISGKVQPEYVLKVELNEDGIDSKSVSPKNNPNPENLPAIRKVMSPLLKKTIVYTLLFVFAFLFSVFIGFNIVFLAFEI